MKTETAWISKPGGRKSNQDACGFTSDEAGGCWVVADGLGGHAGGEIASRVAVDEVLRRLPSAGHFSREALSASFAAAQQELHAKAAEPSLVGMRTTLAVLACRENKALWGHVGDSRIYWFRQGKILHQTLDHSVPQMLVSAGKLSASAIRGHEDQNRLTRALGQEGPIRPELLPDWLECQASDAALLCTDGIWTWVWEQEMEAALTAAQSAAEWLAELERLVLARATGAYDNYTAIAILFSRSAQA